MAAPDKYEWRPEMIVTEEEEEVEVVRSSADLGGAERKELMEQQGPHDPPAELEGRELKRLAVTSENEDHSHEFLFPDGPIPRGYYRSSTTNGHFHEAWIEEPMEPGDVASIVTSRDFPMREEFGGHAHEVEVAAVAEEEEGAETMGARPSMETKLARSPKPLEFKEAARNGVPVGIVAGYLSTWESDEGGIFGVPDQFVRGAWTRSIEDHKRRGNRQVRLKDMHGRTIGGFPIESVREDGVGLYAVGEINLETQQGREAYSLVKQGVLTDFSVGYNAVEDRIEGGVRKIYVAHLWESSIVDEPANQSARILEVKAAVPFQDLPLADRSRSWNSSAAAGRVRRLLDSQEEPSRDYRKAFLWFDSQDWKSFGAYKLPIADVVDGTLVAVPRAVFAAAAALRGARGGVDLPDQDRPRVIRHVERYYAKMDEESPFSREERQFVGAAEAREIKAPDLERILVRTGFFSQRAATLLASRLRESPCYDEEALSRMVSDLQEAKSRLSE